MAGLDTSFSGNISGPGGLRSWALVMSPRYQQIFVFGAFLCPTLILFQTHIVESSRSEDAEEPNFPGRERPLAQTSQAAKGEFQ